MLREQCCGELRDAEWPSNPQRAGRQGSRIPQTLLQSLQLQIYQALEKRKALSQCPSQ